MITLIKKENQTCPVIICDTCGKEITDFNNGNYIWEPGKENEFRFVHKGKCDDRIKYSYSMEIKHFLIYLMNNLKFKQKDLKITQRDCGMLSQIE